MGIGRCQHGVNELYNLHHVLLLETAGSDGGGTYAKTAGGKSAAGVKGHHVLVHGDIGLHQFLLCETAGEIREFGAQVNEHEVVVGAVRDDLVALVQEFHAHGFGVGQHLLLVFNVFRLGSLVEGYGLGGDHVLQRAALYAGEDAGIEDGTHLLDLSLRSGETPGVVKVLAHEDDTAAGTAKRLVGGGSDNMSVFDGVLQETGGNEAGGVGHVNPEDGAHFVGDGSHALVVPLAGVGRCTADDELGLALEGFALHLIVVYAAGLGIEAVGDGVVEDTAGVHG